jgi:hypothetical protein
METTFPDLRCGLRNLVQLGVTPELGRGFSPDNESPEQSTRN